MVRPMFSPLPFQSVDELVERLSARGGVLRDGIYTGIDTFKESTNYWRAVYDETVDAFSPYLDAFMKDLGYGIRPNPAERLYSVQNNLPGTAANIQYQLGDQVFEVIAAEHDALYNMTDGFRTNSPMVKYMALHEHMHGEYTGGPAGLGSNLRLLSKDTAMAKYFGQYAISAFKNKLKDNPPLGEMDTYLGLAMMLRQMDRGMNAGSLSDPTSPNLVEFNAMNDSEIHQMAIIAEEALKQYLNNPYETMEGIMHNVSKQLEMPYVDATAEYSNPLDSIQGAVSPLHTYLEDHLEQPINNGVNTLKRITSTIATRAVEAYEDLGKIQNQWSQQLQNLNPFTFKPNMDYST